MIGVTFALIGLAVYSLALFVLGLLWERRVAQKIRKDRLVISQPFSSDPLLALYGSGKELWADEHADEYVERLRRGWQ